MEWEKYLTPAVLVAAGAVLGKLAELFFSRRQSDLTNATTRFIAVSDAHQKLVDDLFKQVDSLSEQIKTLHEDIEKFKKTLAECETKHTESAHRVDELERQLARLTTMPPA
jgi:uncharacterized coiled-coil DUF342 family protein